MAEPRLRQDAAAAADGFIGAVSAPDAQRSQGIAAPPSARQPRRLRRAALTAGVLAALWAALLPGDIASWWLGVPAVLAGGAVTLLVPAPDRRRLGISPLGAARFAGYFVIQSLRGAADVAWRACQRQMPIDPGFRTYAMSLPEGPAQVIMANVITLLPGTLSAEFQGQTLVVHMLDQTQDLSADLTDLERRVAALFGLPQNGPERTA